MNKLYERIEELCNKNNISITEMCRASGAPRGSLTDLKMGRTNGLAAKNLQKIAEYFGVTVGYLLGAEESPDKNKDVAPHDFQAAFWGGDKDLSPEERELLWKDVQEYAKFKMDQMKKKKQ